jgi:hypothetical protein
MGAFVGFGDVPGISCGGLLWHRYRQPANHMLVLSLKACVLHHRVAARDSRRRR